MRASRRKKLIVIIVFISIISIIISLILYALRQNINLFYSPTQISVKKAPLNHEIRVGGMVVPGSIQRSSDGLTVTFKVTDYENNLQIQYRGSLPDLFREGQGIVALGRLVNENEFQAKEVLAKHDEKYMPPEVRGILRKS